MSTVKRFSDFATEDMMLVGDKVQMHEILGREIEIINFAHINSKYTKLCTKIQFRMNNQLYFVFTGSTVVAGQLEKYKNELPFVAKIAKADRCFTLA